MNILNVVFVKKKKKKNQENSSKNTGVEENELFVEILLHSKADIECALLKRIC